MDRRAARRDRPRKVARLIGADGKVISSCIVLDASCSGARLLVEKGTVPDEFALVQKSDRLLRQAEVVRRDFKTIAVTFRGEPLELSATDPRIGVWFD